MKHFLSVLLLLCAAQVSAQELSDSVWFGTELEDSLSSLSIVQIKDPKELLQGITEQLSLDMKQEPKVCRYEVEETYGTGLSAPCTVKGIVSASAGLRVRKAELEGDFSFKGRYRLTPQDSALTRMVLPQIPEMSPLLQHIESLSMSVGSSLPAAIRSMVDAYDVKAYRISDETGRSVYRIDFLPGKMEITQDNSSLYSMIFSGVAYFDTNSLRLKQTRVLSYINTRNPWVFIASGGGQGLSFYPFYAKMTSYDARKLCRIDYEEYDGTLIMGRLQMSITKDKKTVTEATVQRLPLQASPL